MNMPAESPPGKDCATLLEQVRPALVSILVLTLLTGVAYPLGLALLARPLFSHQANGSLLTKHRKVVGSRLISQSFTSPKYFHPRPSAAGTGHDATASGGTNLAPTSAVLKRDTDALEALYRRTNDLGSAVPIPADAVTRSGSGLDPHISPENAVLQSARVARARGIAEEDVRTLVQKHTTGRLLGLLGAPRVNVLTLNLALDQDLQGAGPVLDH